MNRDKFINWSIGILFFLCIAGIIIASFAAATAYQNKNNSENDKIKNLTSDVIEIQSELKHIGIEVKDITTETDQLKNDINEMQNEIDEQTNDINDLQLDITNLNNSKVSKGGDTMTGALNMGNQNISNVNLLDVNTNIQVNDQPCKLTKCYQTGNPSPTPITGTTGEFYIPPGTLVGDFIFPNPTPLGFMFFVKMSASIDLQDEADTFTLYLNVNDVVVSSLLISRGDLSVSQEISAQYIVQINEGNITYRNVNCHGTMLQYALIGSGPSTSVSDTQNSLSWSIPATGNILKFSGRFSNATSSFLGITQLSIETNFNL